MKTNKKYCIQPYKPKTLIESSNRSLAFFKVGNNHRFINEIRPKLLDMIREHAISGIHMKNRCKIVLVLYAINFVCQKYAVFQKTDF